RGPSCSGRWATPSRGRRPDSPACIPARPRRLLRPASLVVGVARDQPTVRPVLLEALHRLRFLLPLRLAVDAETGEGQRFETPFGDVGLAALAHAVGSVLDPGEGVVDRLQLLAIAVGQDE